MSPHPCPRVRLGPGQRSGWLRLRHHGHWPPGSQAPASCPTCSFSCQARAQPVPEARQAGLEPGWASPKVALGRAAEPCRGSTCPWGGGREQCLAGEPRDESWSIPPPPYAQSHAHTEAALCTQPGEACPFPFLLPSLNLNGQACPGALVLPSPWARKPQRDPHAGLWT